MVFKNGNVKQEGVFNHDRKTDIHNTILKAVPRKYITFTRKNHQMVIYGICNIGLRPGKRYLLAEQALFLKRMLMTPLKFYVLELKILF